LSSIPADIGTLSKLGILDLHSNQVAPHLLYFKLVNSIFSSFPEYTPINNYPEKKRKEKPLFRKLLLI
jgi:hypothetical protein